MSEKPVINVSIRKSDVLTSKVMGYNVIVSSGEKKAEFYFLGETNLENYVEPFKILLEQAGFEVNVNWE